MKTKLKLLAFLPLLLWSCSDDDGPSEEYQDKNIQLTTENIIWFFDESLGDHSTFTHLEAVSTSSSNIFDPLGKQTTDFLEQFKEFCNCDNKPLIRVMIVDLPDGKYVTTIYTGDDWDVNYVYRAPTVIDPENKRVQIELDNGEYIFLENIKLTESRFRVADGLYRTERTITATVKYDGKVIDWKMKY